MWKRRTNPLSIFEAWLRGTERYQPFQLRKAADRRFLKHFSQIYLDLVITCVEAGKERAKDDEELVRLRGGVGYQVRQTDQLTVEFMQFKLA